MTGARETIESRNDFHQPCPRCGGTLDDRTHVDWTGIVPGGASFFRIRFTCPQCSYFLCNRFEPFNVLAYGATLLDARTQRVRMDLVHAITQMLMAKGVESYSGGKVWTIEPTKVCKSVGGIGISGGHTILASLARRYTEDGQLDLAERALEIAVDELCSIGAEEFPQVMGSQRSVETAIWILSALDERYRAQGRNADDLIRRADEWWSRASGGQPPPWW
jgi:hypothetical protein